MKKTGIVLSVLLIAGVAVTGGAWFTGQQLETHLESKLAEANQELARQLPGSSIRLESLQRGLFGSQARYRIDLGEQAAELPSSELVLVEHIEHGPLPLSRLVRLQLMPVLTYGHARLEEGPLTAPLFRMANGAEPLSLHTALGYDQTASLVVEVAPLRHADAELEFAFSGFTGDFEVGTEVLRGAGQVARLELVTLGEQPGTLHVQDFRFDMDRVKGDAGIYLGEESARVSRVDLTLADMAPLVLSQLDLRDRISQNGDLLAAEFFGQVASVSYADQPLGSLRLDWSAHDLDAAGLMALADLLNRYAEAPEAESQELTPAQEQELLAALQAVLASEPRLSLDRLALRTANAESLLSIAVGLRQAREEPLSLDDAIREMLASLDIRLDVPKDSIRDLVGYKALLNPMLDPDEVALEAGMAAEMAGTMALGMGLATLEGDTLRARLSYADDQVTFNGNTQSLDEFLMVLGMLLGAE